MYFKEFLEEDSIKIRTLKRMYHLIHQHGPVSKVDLLQLMNLKQTTLVRMIDELLKYQFIYESGMGKSSGGRPPVLYQINPKSSYIIGIDISRTHTTVIILDLEFNIIDKSTFAMTSGHTPEIVIKRLINIIKYFMKSHHLHSDVIIGIGIGSVGPLDRKHGIILNPESFSGKGWNNVPIVDQLRKSFPVNVLLENGANTAALGEYYQLPLINNNILYCISGMGLRCGMLVNGQVVQNKMGDASAFGHMVIDIKGNECVCGQNGCLLSYISLNAISQKIVDRISTGEHSIITEWVNGEIHKISFENMTKACKLGDYLVNQVVLEAAHYYGIGIANMINLMHPEHVILNGPLIYEHQSYFETIVSTANQYIFHANKNTINFSKGKLMEDAVAVGAAAHLFNTFFNKKGDYV